MTKTDANPPMPLWSDEYQLVEVDADYLAKAVKPKQFIHIDQSECIMCEGCVDICPWKCIHMVRTMCYSLLTTTCARVAPCVLTVAQRESSFLEKLERLLQLAIHILEQQITATHTACGCKSFRTRRNIWQAQLKKSLASR